MKLLLNHIFGQVSPRQWFIHGLLFLLTFLSTTWTGFELVGFDTSQKGGTKEFLNSFLGALSYSLPVMVILTGHEMGHYVMARLYGVPVSLPYFIPLPLISPFGTMGAFIRMYRLPVDRRSLFDIAFWGPLMSFLLSVPFLVVGISFSKVVPLTPNFEGLIFGDSLLTKFTISLFYQVPQGHDLEIHPMAFAGWTGLFITALNLLPIGQLDGGHIAYAVLGKGQKFLSYATLILLFLFSLIFVGWFFLGLILIFLGIRHPPLPAEYFGTINFLDATRRKLAFFSLGIFLLCFVPVPVQTHSFQDLDPSIQNEQSPNYPEDIPEDVLDCETECGEGENGYYLFNPHSGKPQLGV